MYSKLSHCWYRYALDQCASITKEKIGELLQHTSTLTLCETTSATPKSVQTGSCVDVSKRERRSGLSEEGENTLIQTSDDFIPELSLGI